MTDRIAATEGALRAGAEAVNGAHGDVAAVTGRIEGVLDELRAAWTGSAATSYAGMMRQWQADVRSLQQTLTNLEEALRATDRDQLATEEAHQQAIAGLAGMMGGS